MRYARGLLFIFNFFVPYHRNIIQAALIVFLVPSICIAQASKLPPDLEEGTRYMITITPGVEGTIKIENIKNGWMQADLRLKRNNETYKDHWINPFHIISLKKIPGGGKGQQSSTANSANIDAVRQDIISIASSAQQYFMKPKALGGGGQSYTNITFQDISFPAAKVSQNGLIAINSNGKYVITQGNKTLTITAHPNSRIDGSVTFGATAENTIKAKVIKDKINWIDKK